MPTQLADGNIKMAIFTDLVDLVPAWMTNAQVYVDGNWTASPELL